MPTQHEGLPKLRGQIRGSWVFWYPSGQTPCDLWSCMRADPTDPWGCTSLRWSPAPPPSPPPPTPPTHFASAVEALWNPRHAPSHRPCAPSRLLFLGHTIPAPTAFAPQHSPPAPPAQVRLRAPIHTNTHTHTNAHTHTHTLARTNTRTRSDPGEAPSCDPDRHQTGTLTGPQAE